MWVNRIEVESSPESRAIQAVYSGARHPGTETYSVLAVGRKGEIRWLVDQRARRIVGQVFEAWRPYSRLSRAAWMVLRYASGLRVLRLIPGVHRISIPAAQYGAWIESCPQLKGCAPVVFIGKPSITEKLTVFLGDGSGKIAAVAKLALTAAAMESIDNEAYALQHLREVIPGIPPLLSVDSTRGVCIQGWVRGRSVGRGLTEKHLALLLKLPRSGRSVSMREAWSALIKSMRPEHKRIAEAYLAQREFCGELRILWEHGDFAPWNIKKSPGGNLVLLDWEYASANGLPLLDLLHFFYRQQYLFRDMGSIPRVMEANQLVRKYCLAFELTQEMRKMLASYYLLRSLRYEIPSLSGEDTYESFVARQLELLQ